METSTRTNEGCDLEGNEYGNEGASKLEPERSGQLCEEARGAGPFGCSAGLAEGRLLAERARRLEGEQGVP